MKKRLLAGAMAVASIAALLTGCGGSGSNQAAGDCHREYRFRRGPGHQHL